MEQLAELLTFKGFISLFTLAILEIVLGIDNIIFISIVSDKVSKEKRAQARNLGITLALVVRIALLFGITWVIGLKEPMFTVFEHPFSGRDLILLGGGLFLIAKSTSEIHGTMQALSEGEEEHKGSLGFGSAVIQIVLIDIVFSFDSILTAVGLVQNVAIMVTAVVIALCIMMIFMSSISGFINHNPTIKMLALSFLVMIGFLLIVESMHVEVPKQYVYVAMGFSFFVELLNMRYRKKAAKNISDKNLPTHSVD